MDSKKFEKLITLSLCGILVGLVLFFVKFIMGLLVLIVSVIYFYRLTNRYPEQFKDWTAKNAARQEATKKLNEQVQKAQDKKFDLVHIKGINFVSPKQEICCVLHDNVVNFTDKKRTNLKNLSYSDIENIIMLEEIEQTRKNKSVIGRAIVGGLILGPVAAVVGGISGAVPTTQNNKKYYLKIQIHNEGNNELIVTGQNKILSELKENIVKKIEMQG